MELIQGKHKTSKSAKEDVISNMPDIVITNILDRVPLQDAVRTGVLSRNWRFKWTMLSQLVFDEDFFKYLSKTKGKNNYVGIISRILLYLRGAIDKFVLCVDDCGYPVLDAEDVNNWVLFLSRKGIQDLTLHNLDGSTILELSTHLFSCLELKHLSLCDCFFHPPVNFHGFPNLLSLELIVKFKENTELGEFFTGCPLLEIFTIDDLFDIGKVNLAEIAKLKNLKILTLGLSGLNKTMIASSSAIFELLGSLPKLHELHLEFIDCTLTEGVATKGFSTTYPCLKTLKLSNICLDNGMKSSFAFELIRSFPNLQNLEITARDSDAGTPTQVDYKTMALLQLRSVMFEYLKGSENEVCLIKYILACSPSLKKIVIRHHPFPEISSEEKLMFAKKLLNLHRASPIVEIDLC